uniref:Uncharacterized protein n=1 Tax=Cannabis sativa TaxID=3483 RepID=A0A803QWV8_CANSA
MNNRPTINSCIRHELKPHLIHYFPSLITLQFFKLVCQNTSIKEHRLASSLLHSSWSELCSYTIHFLHSITVI